MQNEERQITFNDIPEVLSEILKRFDLLDQSMELIREEVRRTKRPSLSDHIPMDVKEACEFLKIKKSTMYRTEKSLSIRRVRNTPSLGMTLSNGWNLAAR